MSKCELPPCPPCPPPPPPPCPQVCAPPPPMPPCRVKPIMRGLHWAQTERNITGALSLAVVAGFCVWFFIGKSRKFAYKDYYLKGEFEDYADEMARKGLFQSVPASALQDYK